ncbi:uncharacterized protein LOC124672499 [Lolium rigidum]|uniref:uncharacterized protein LOC124672499 n=1 Tax=Lolium rigidum TaxID=89674 RepID=UPI001F5C4EED|nr:uncharacterized protein LOC124672499 [Lolium rigidum]
MFITCLDTALIPDTWDLKIKNEFFRLRFEVEGGKHAVPSDVTMSEAPGEGGDDDPKAPDNQKRDELDRNNKRTKNVGENDANKNGSSTSPNGIDNTVGKNAMILSQPQANSEVADKAGECMPKPIVNLSPSMLQTSANQMGSRAVQKGGVEAAVTSIGGDIPRVHAAAAQIHAAVSRAVTASGSRTAAAVSPPSASAGQDSGRVGGQPGMYGTWYYL